MVETNVDEEIGRIYQGTGGQNFFTCGRLTTTSHIKNISKEKGVYCTSTPRYLTLRVAESQLPRTVLVMGTEICLVG